MKTIKLIRGMAAVLLLVAAPALQADAGSTSAVMTQLANHHESLFANPQKSLDTTQLVALLKSGGNSAKATRLFQKALPIAMELGKASDPKARLDLYGRLVDVLAKLHVPNDKSGTHVFYCPMARKKWIARGEAVRNPYMPDMRSCGSRRTGG